MSGSGKGVETPTSSATVAATQPAYLKNTQAATMPAFLPGQQAQLAQDLNAGFPGGVGANEWMKALAQMYQPAATLNFNAPAAARPAAKPVAKPAPKTSPLNMAKPTARVVPIGGRNAR